VTSNEHVAYLTYRDGKAVCLVQPVAGGEARPVDLRNALPNLLISSGGTTILSVSLDDQLSIWRAQADGSGARRLSDRSGEVAVHISPDGKRISIAQADSARGASIVSTESGQIERTFPDAYLGLAFFAPDGRRVDVPSLEPDSRGLIHGVHRIFSLEDGRQIARVQPPPTALAPTPGLVGWNSATDAISFIDGADPGNNVFNLPLDSSAPYQVTRFSEGRTKFICWSPDGAFLAVVRTVGGADNVWLVSRRGEPARQVTRFTTEQIFFPPIWAPDSRRLVVNAGSSSQDAVLIRDFR
jgi:Tol biopolymer transport system component